MGDKRTGAMQEFQSSRGSTTNAGFVLLYAEDFGALPAAWPVPRVTTVIGRDDGCDLVLPVNAVSRAHAQVTWERGGFTLRDLDSTNGVLVDGHRITEARLETHTEVRIGDAILKFVEEDAEHYEGYAIDGTVRAPHVRRATLDQEVIGGYQMDHVLGELDRVAKSELSVMLLGESGTGKEVIARELHRAAARRGGFCAVNCAAIPGNLLESELFGYKRGAFSGADRDKPGLIRTAHDGTLLLDEIGDMPLEAQAKLLRVLQSKEVFPLGATSPERVDVRVVCATHRDLTRLQSEGKFRQDLFARLNEYQLRLPPLRERKEDLYALLRAFLARHGRPSAAVSFQFMTGLVQYDWPYNVRELEACVKRCVALAESTRLDADLLPEPVREAMLDYGARTALATDDAGAKGAPTETQLRELLSRHQGNVAAVGRDLGKARMQIHRWLKRFEIDLEEFR